MGHTCSGPRLTTRISTSLSMLSTRGTESPGGFASSRALPTTLSSAAAVGITASRCDNDPDGGAKGEGETDEDADATGGRFCGSADTADLGWWERKRRRRYQRKKSRVCGD